MWAARSIARGFAALALLFKLLIPVGYMPASLAEGGPIRLCSDVFATSGAAQLPSVADDVRASLKEQSFHDDHDHDTHRSGPGHHGEHAADLHGDQGDAARHDALSDHGTAGSPHQHHDDSVAGHHTWERCYLGGLSFQAALTYEWRMPEPAKTPSFVLPADVENRVRSAIVAFRSRAPPVTPV